MFHRGATAVEKFTDSGYFVAIKGEGLYFYDGNDHWEELLILDKTIRSLKMLGTYLFGVGEEGFIFRLNTEDFTSLTAHLPTTAAIWSITGNDSGHAVIHGKHTIYQSSDYGRSWTGYKPFKNLASKPVIRSLCLHGDQLYIGTQIHAENGGLWKYDCSKGSVTRVKKETHSMISSIAVDKNRNLLICKGSSKGASGSIEMANLEDRSMTFWSSCQTIFSEEAFLDIFCDETVIYASSSHDKYGYSRIYTLNADTMDLFPAETLKGHAFRVAGTGSTFFAAGLYESKQRDLHAFSDLVH
ncbi:exo-alpha-sialidase [Bacillus sp. PAMC26568]|nr:exo-alpha-sialidase [Bacillus sp. PAMC26568]